MRPQLILACADPMIALRYRIDLLNEGFEVVWVKNALECAAALRHRLPTLMILDVDVPWGGGWGILALMKEGELPSVPVLLLMNRTDTLPPALDEPLDFAILYKPADSKTVADVSVSIRVIAAPENGDSCLRQPRLRRPREVGNRS